MKYDELDSTDRKILRILQNDSTLTVKELAAIQDIEEITECYNTSGEYDFTLKIQTRDMDSYQEFMRTKLGNSPKICCRRLCSALPRRARSIR